MILDLLLSTGMCCTLLRLHNLRRASQEEVMRSMVGDIEVLDHSLHPLDVVCLPSDLARLLI